MSSFEVIENSQKDIDEFGHCYGYDIVFRLHFKISKEDIQALLDSKMLATTFDDECSIFISLEEQHA